MSGDSLSGDGATPAEAHVVTILFDPETLDGWLALREEALPPLHVSELVTTDEDRREFLRGATMLRFHGPRAMRGRSVKPQQLLVADVLAAGHQKNAALLPRRSSKSTSVLAVALGRAEARDDYRVGVLTMTTGKAGRSRFLKDVVPAIERSGLPLGSYKVVRAAGQERIEFPTSGGSVAWLSTVDDLRGEAFDLIILDEAGEADPQKVEDTLAAALPTLDTRPGAQIVVAGTAGKYRRGNLLHDWLVLGRTPDPETGEVRAGIVEYAMPETLTEEDTDSWEAIRPHVLASHPGIGTLTTEKAIRDNYLTLPRETFLREYGGLFGDEGGSVSLFDPLKWARTGVDGALPAPPERFSLAFAPHPDQISVSIVAAWRDDEGRAVALQLDHLSGIDEAAPRLLKYARRYKVPVVYDAGSQVGQLIVERLTRATPRPKLHPFTYPDVKRAASLIVDEVDRENVVHYRDQLVLTEAIHLTVKRKSGDRGWLLGRDPKRPDDDITPAEAWAIALLHYDGSKPKPRVRSFVVTD